MWDVRGCSALIRGTSLGSETFYATCERLLITASKHRRGSCRLGSIPSMSLKGEKSSMVVLWWRSPVTPRKEALRKAGGKAMMRS